MKKYVLAVFLGLIILAMSGCFERTVQNDYVSKPNRSVPASSAATEEPKVYTTRNECSWRLAQALREGLGALGELELKTGDARGVYRIDRINFSSIENGAADNEFLVYGTFTGYDRNDSVEGNYQFILTARVRSDGYVIYSSKQVKKK